MFFVETFLMLDQCFFIAPWPTWSRRFLFLGVPVGSIELDGMTPPNRSQLGLAKR